MNQGIFDIQSNEEFTHVAMQVFKHQFENNKVYRSFCDLLYIHPSGVSTIEEIPFLPIQFFKSHEVTSSNKGIEEVFTSSGTTGQKTSKHLVADISVYQKSYLKGFKHFYGDINEYTILALLPNYLERKGSSLIYMVHDLIEKLKFYNLTPMELQTANLVRTGLSNKEIAEVLGVGAGTIMAHRHSLRKKLGLKNMKGCLYKREKVKLHQLPPSDDVPSPAKPLDMAIADMSRVLIPDLTVIDGTFGQEGLGPSAGTVKETDLVIASTDCLAADR